MTAFAAGGYRYVPGVMQYSAGVAAMPGYEIVRVRFRRPVPLDAGFARIERLIGDAGRPLAAFCACELRSPAPFTEAGFRAYRRAAASQAEPLAVALHAVDRISLRPAERVAVLGAGGIGQELMFVIRQFVYADISAIVLLIMSLASAGVLAPAFSRFSSGWSWTLEMPWEM